MSAAEPIIDASTGDFIWSEPRGVSYPESVFYSNSYAPTSTVSTRASPLLVALAITFFILLILVCIYLIWVLFVKRDDQNYTDIFSWFTGA